MSTSPPTPLSDQPAGKPSKSSPRGRAAIPPDEKVPLKEKLAYGFGGLSGGIDSASEKYVLNPIFVITCGISPAIMSYCAVFYSFWSGFCEMIVGAYSDKTRTRWGRRKPYMVVGAILMAIWMPALFMFNKGWSLPWIIAWMVGAHVVALIFNAIWNIPYQCLLLECTPNSNERTNVAAWRAYTGTMAGLGMSWLWWLIQRPIFNDAAGNTDIIHGAVWVFSGLGVLVLIFGLMPLLVKERTTVSAEKKPATNLTLRENLRYTFTSRPFVILILFTFLMTLAGAVKAGLEFFTRFNYVYRGDQQLAATISGVGGTISTFVSLTGIPLFQWIANRWSKILAVKLIMGIGFFASISTLFFFTPSNPYLSLIPGLLFAPAATAIWVLIPSMTGDCVDEDQLRTDRRREGSFQSTFSWVLRLSTAIATLISGPIVVLLGYNAALKGQLQPESVIFNMRIVLAIVPAAIMGLAIWMIHKYPLNPKRIGEIHDELKARRAAG